MSSQLSCNSCDYKNENSNSNSNTLRNNNTNNSQLEVQKSTKKQISVQIKDIMQEEQKTVKKENPYLKREKFTNLETLKLFFEEEWNPDFFEFEIVDPDDELTEREKLAYIKMNYFVGGYYIDDYDEIIEKAYFKVAGYNVTLDQIQANAENLFQALIIRSQVLELYENCGKVAGILYDPDKGVSDLQIYSDRTYYLLPLIYSLVGDPQYYEWNYEKVKAVFELWQAGVVCGCYVDDESEEDFEILYDKLLGFLNLKKLEFSDKQTTILQQILEAGKSFCNK